MPQPRPPAVSTRTPRTGRRPGGAATREAILAAAQQLFAERGYEGASMRAIAAAAGVDAALITHFFGSKAGLLAAATEWPFDPAERIPAILSGGPEEVGERLAAQFVHTWDRERARNPLITLLRAATSEPEAARLLGEALRTRIFVPLFAGLGVDHPEIRANLVASQIGGLVLARYILGFEPLASAPAEDVIAWVGPTLQRYLTGPI